MNDSSKEKNDNADKSIQSLKIVMSWVVVIILTIFGAFSLYKFSNVHKTEGDFWLTLIREQFPVVVGLPIGGLLSLFVTLVLTYISLFVIHGLRILKINGKQRKMKEFCKKQREFIIFSVARTINFCNYCI